MRWVQHNAAGPIVFDLPKRPSGAGSARVLSAAGAVLQASPTVTLDSVNTTLSGAVVAGASSLTVASGTGIAAGRRYLLAGSETDGGEVVLVSSVASTTVTLARRLGRAQSSGATFQGTRVTVAITSASTAQCSRGLRVEWTDPTTSDVLAIPFDVTRYAPTSWLTVQDLYDLDPTLRKRLPEGTWLPALRDRAWEILLDDLGTKDRHPGGYAGVIDLTIPHGYLVRSIVAETVTDAEGVAYRDDMRAQYERTLARALNSVPYDEGNSGATATGSAASWRGIPLVRA